MKPEKKELLTSLLILGFAVTILLGSVLAMRDFNSRQEKVTGRFVFDNGCYGIYNYGRLSCIASSIGKQCINGCYVANTPAGNRCECIP